MPDYGHELSFGAFLTPSNADPAAVVALAVHCEDAGLDLVTFQDHPYQPRFLDTWTLLSYVAARTRRVRLSGNVLNLPLRQPAVLARSVASLDLLSGGRTELALGAGAFWDAIVAMGGTRLSAGEAVQALGEAIDVVRGIWDTTDRRPLKVPGEFHRLDGAKRGPAPAHDVPIVLGAYGPRMLTLVGRKADGWLPSLGFARDLDLGAGNERIDAAAVEAGRDPRAIRRMLNVVGDGLHGTVADWPEQVAELALRDGISSFVLGTDDPELLSRYAREVAPAVREQVATARDGRAT
ncbi:luciferase-like monooxygenase [Mumia flava]|uniref:Luciferase-like monooxygenase n=1 Tax=Mumia flava TaxID=1348852 RepID=A0A2M9B7M8_9ACTN|nr:LLM class flavin-dependent oxidoreductase [Mumia flava]PJJ53959.1 luciferase-like monooxygenase [Mumia flava]